MFEFLHILVFLLAIEFQFITKFFFTFNFAIFKFLFIEHSHHGWIL